MNCTRCDDTTHIDFPSGLLRCDGCERAPSWCRCAPVKAERRPLWLERSRERRNGLARDLTGIAA